MIPNRQSLAGCVLCWKSRYVIRSNMLVQTHLDAQTDRFIASTLKIFDIALLYSPISHLPLTQEQLAWLTGSQNAYYQVHTIWLAPKLSSEYIPQAFRLRHMACLGGFKSDTRPSRSAIYLLHNQAERKRTVGMIRCNYNRFSNYAVECS